MSRRTEFSPQDYALIQRGYANLMESVRARCKSPEHIELVRKAFEFASSAHKDIRRRSGEPYIMHSIAVAKIVCCDIGLGCKSICAALLHDVMEDSSYTIDDIQNLFGSPIASLVDGMSKIKGMLDGSDTAGDPQILQAENFRRILLTLNEDVKVVLIKMADRLHNCRTIEYMPEYKRERILSETMYIFVPLAHRLGLYSIKTEMENIWLRFKEPQAYNEIQALINADSTNKDSLIEEFLVPIREAMDRCGIEYNIKKRVKSPYSIWHKIQTKHVTFEQIGDLYAVRIVFNPKSSDLGGERNECFQIFSLITGIYDYRPERVRDWVMHPKTNGYEALHLTAVARDGHTNIEVQIRSRRMDEVAEKGIAAHWNYKKMQPQTQESEMDLWISKVKDVLQTQDVNSTELMDLIHNDLVEKEIFIYDNKGNACSVPKGATALDFGFLHNPEDALHAIAAKVNYRLSPLSCVLHTGDRVEIVTSLSARPQLEWTKFLKTAAAQHSVYEYFSLDGNVPQDTSIPTREVSLSFSVDNADENAVKQICAHIMDSIASQLPGVHDIKCEMK